MEPDQIAAIFLLGERGFHHAPQMGCCCNCCFDFWGVQIISSYAWHEASDGGEWGKPTEIARGRKSDARKDLLRVAMHGGGIAEKELKHGKTSRIPHIEAS